MNLELLFDCDYFAFVILYWFIIVLVNNIEFKNISVSKIDIL